MRTKNHFTRAQNSQNAAQKNKKRPVLFFARNKKGTFKQGPPAPRQLWRENHTREPGIKTSAVLPWRNKEGKQERSKTSNKWSGRKQKNFALLSFLLFASQPISEQNADSYLWEESIHFRQWPGLWVVQMYTIQLNGCQLLCHFALCLLQCLQPKSNLYFLQRGVCIKRSVKSFSLLLCRENKNSFTLSSDSSSGVGCAVLDWNQISWSYQKRMAIIRTAAWNPMREAVWQPLHSSTRLYWRGGHGTYVSATLSFGFDSTVLFVCFVFFLFVSCILFPMTENFGFRSKHTNASANGCFFACSLEPLEIASTGKHTRNVQEIGPSEIWFIRLILGNWCQEKPLEVMWNYVLQK